jgi:YidC/Oxa1 family membrane protein insertase
MMTLYKDEGVNPVSGCLPLVFLVFFIAIYRVIIHISNAGFSIDSASLYSFVANPGGVNHLFLNFLDLTHPSIPLGILTALAQYFQMKMILGNVAVVPLKKGDGSAPDFATMMNKQMLYMGPAITLFIGATFPAALSLYWLTSTLFMLAQQKVTFRAKSPETT